MDGDPPDARARAPRSCAAASAGPSTASDSCRATSCCWRPATRCPPICACCRSHGLQVQEAILTGESLPVEKRTDPVAGDAALGDRTCMAFSGTLVASRPGPRRRRRHRRGDRDRTHQRDACRGRDADHAAGAADGCVRPLADRPDPAVLPRSCSRSATSSAHYRFAEHVHGGGRPVGGGDPGGPAGRADDHAGDRRARHGAAQCHRAAPAGDRDAGLGVGDLHRQDRHAHPQRDDRGSRGHARRRASPSRARATHRSATSRCAATRGRRAMRSAAAGGTGAAPPRCATTRRCASTKATGRSKATRWKAHCWPSPARPAWTRARNAAPGRAPMPSPSMPGTASWRRCNHDHEGHACIFVKGAPERILGDVRRAAHRGGRRGAAGRRLLAAAGGSHRRAPGSACSRSRRRPVPPEHTVLEHADVEGSLTLLGMVGLIDPPRPEAIAAVAECRAPAFA